MVGFFFLFLGFLLHAFACLFVGLFESNHVLVEEIRAAMICD